MTRTISADDKLRIVQVMASGPGSGGIEKHFFDLCNRLAQNHTVVAVSHPAYRRGLSQEVQFESLGRFIGRRNPATVFRLARVLRKWRPEIVHAHASRAAAIVLQASPIISTARIATIHGLKRRPLVFHGFDRVIAVSRGVAAQLPGVRTEVIYNGIEPPSLSTSAREGVLSCVGQSPVAGPVAVSVGRLDPVKGFDVLIDAWRGVDGRLWIVGEGPQRRQLEVQIRAAGLEDRIRLLGFRRDVPDLLAAADLTVIASRREGFGYTLAEALLLRQLVVSTDVPAANEFLPAPFVVPCEDPPALRKSIIATLADQTAASRSFEPVWERASAEFTIDAMVAATTRLYREVSKPTARKLRA